MLAVGYELAQFFEKFPDRTAVIEIRQWIERRRVPIDNGKQGAALFGDNGKSGGRLDLERGAYDHEDLRALAQFLGSRHGLSGHLLAERDGGGFEKTAAPVAHRSGKIAHNGFHDLFRSEIFSALEADYPPVRPVELHDLFFGHPGQAMEPVDILRDQSEQLASVLKGLDGVMAYVRFDVLIELVDLLLHSPGSDARGFAADKFREVDRRVSRPDPARASKIGHAGLRADSRAGEKDDIATGADFCSKLFESGWTHFTPKPKLIRRKPSDRIYIESIHEDVKRRQGRGRGKD